VKTRGFPQARIRAYARIRRGSRLLKPLGRAWSRSRRTGRRGQGTLERAAFRAHARTWAQGWRRAQRSSNAARSIPAAARNAAGKAFPLQPTRACGASARDRPSGPSPRPRARRRRRRPRRRDRRAAPRSPRRGAREAPPAPRSVSRASAAVHPLEVPARPSSNQSGRDPGTFRADEGVGELVREMGPEPLRGRPRRRAPRPGPGSFRRRSRRPSPGVRVISSKSSREYRITGTSCWAAGRTRAKAGRGPPRAERSAVRATSGGTGPSNCSVKCRLTSRPKAVSAGCSRSRRSSLARTRLRGAGSGKRRFPLAPRALGAPLLVVQVAGELAASGSPGAISRARSTRCRASYRSPRRRKSMARSRCTGASSGARDEARSSSARASSNLRPAAPAGRGLPGRPRDCPGSPGIPVRGRGPRRTSRPPRGRAPPGRALHPPRWPPARSRRAPGRQWLPRARPRRARRAWNGGLPWLQS